jgi:hypothetical protein
VIEEELEDGVEFVDHLCYTSEIERFVYGRCILVILTTRLREQVRKTVWALLWSVGVLCWIAGLLLANDGVEWIEIEKVCLFLCCSRRLELF